MDNRTAAALAELNDATAAHARARRAQASDPTVYQNWDGDKTPESIAARERLNAAERAVAAL